MGICYHKDFILHVKRATLWKKGRTGGGTGRKRGCDVTGMVEGVTAMPELSCTDSKVDGVTYLAIASSHFYIVFTCYSPNENRSCEESNCMFFFHIN